MRNYLVYILTAANRRLYEELGIKASLSAIGWFHYIAHFPNGLTENEVDHVLIGIVPNDQPIKPNPEEVQQIQWINIADIKPKGFKPLGYNARLFYLY